MESHDAEKDKVISIPYYLNIQKCLCSSNLLQSKCLLLILPTISRLLIAWMELSIPKQSSHSNTSMRLQLFPHRLWKLIESEAPKLPDVLRWSEDGFAFYIDDEERFVRECLPRHSFKATKIEVKYCLTVKCSFSSSFSFFFLSLFFSYIAVISTKFEYLWLHAA